MGGLDILNAIERVEVDNKDRPIEDIIIQGTHVFVDPYQEADEQLLAERAAENERLAQEKSQSSSSKKTDKVYKAYHTGIGKYIKKDKEKEADKEKESEGPLQPKKKKKQANYSFGNFSSWG